MFEASKTGDAVWQLSQHNRGSWVPAVRKYYGFSFSLELRFLKRKICSSCFSPSRGANGLLHLPTLLKCCKEVHQDKSSLKKDETRFLGSVALALGDLVGQSGFDASNLLHLEIRDWLIKSVYSENLELAAYAIWGLGLLRTDNIETIACLKSVIAGDLRPMSMSLSHYDR